MLSVPAPLRKEHPSLLLERGGPGMQQCLIGQRDLWSLRVAIPTCLWFPANRGVKCRVELVARGGPGARGNPGLCQPGRRPSASPGELAGTAALPSPEHPLPLLATSLCNFAARRGPAGWHGTGGGSPGHPAPSPSLRSAFVSLSPGSGTAVGCLGPSGSQAACTGASRHKTSQLAACRLGAGPGGCRAARRCLCPLRRAGPAADAHRLAPGKEGSVLPRASPAARRSWGAVCRPGGGCDWVPPQRCELEP